MPSDVSTRILNIIANITDQALDPGADHLGEPPWDSLKKIDIIFAIEDEFNIQFSSSDMEQMTNIKAIIDKVIERRE